MFFGPRGETPQAAPFAALPDEARAKASSITHWLKLHFGEAHVLGPEMAGATYRPPNRESDCYVWWLTRDRRRRLLVPRQVMEASIDVPREIIRVLSFDGFPKRLRSCRRWVLDINLILRCTRN